MFVLLRVKFILLILKRRALKVKTIGHITHCGPLISTVVHKLHTSLRK